MDYYEYDLIFLNIHEIKMESIVRWFILQIQWNYTKKSDDLVPFKPIFVIKFR